MMQGGYEQYRNQSLNTMTQGELLLLLLDELVKRLLRADMALGQSEFALFEDSMQRSYEIVRYLDDTLDRSYAIGQQLHRLYDFFCFDISRVKIGRNKQELDRLKAMISDLRDAFREAEKIASSQSGGGEGSST